MSDRPRLEIFAGRRWQRRKNDSKLFEPCIYPAAIDLSDLR